MIFRCCHGGQDQFHVVENYWEAAGVIAGMKADIAPESVRRPFPATVAESSRDASVDGLEATIPSQETQHGMETSDVGNDRNRRASGASETNAPC